MPCDWDTRLVTSEGWGTCAGEMLSNSIECARQDSPTPTIAGRKATEAGNPNTAYSSKRYEVKAVMTRKFMTFKHWKTDEVKTIEFRDAEVPVNPNSERLVVWNETEQKLEDVIKSTIVEIREE